MIDTTLVGATAGAAGAFALTNVITAIATGVDPTLALLTYGLAIVPHPGFIIAGYLFYKYWLKSYIADHKRIVAKREALLEVLLENNNMYRRTHEVTIPRLESKLDDLHGDIHLLMGKKEVETHNENHKV